MQDTYEIYLRFADGATNKMTVYPSANTLDPVIVIFPAMGLRASYYKNFAEVLSKNEMQVITVDHRGHGNSSLRASRHCNFGYREQVENEYPAILEKVRELFPGNKVVVMGHSLGGQMGSLFVSRYSHLVNGLILNASCSVYYKGWEGRQRLGVRAGAEMCRVVSAILGYYPGHKMGFGGLEAKGVIYDWHHTAVTGEYKIHGSNYDYESAMAECKLPILAISYAGDAAAPKKALDNLLNKFSAADDITRHHLTHPDASKNKFDHYSWVKDPAISLSYIKAWIREL